MTIEPEIVGGAPRNRRAISGDCGRLAEGTSAVEPPCTEPEFYLHSFTHILSRGGVDMKSDTDCRALKEGRYIAETGATVRQCANEFGISKSTIHTDVTKRLCKIDRGLCERVRYVLDKNKTERHLRGGLATKEKYKHK